MIDIKPIKCNNLKINEVMKKIKQTIQEVKPENKTIRITLDDISSQLYRSLDFNEIRRLSNKAVYFEIKANMIKDGEINKTYSSKINALTNEFKIFMESNNYDEKEILLDLGVGYIEKIEARNEGK